MFLDNLVIREHVSDTVGWFYTRQVNSLLNMFGRVWSRILMGIRLFSTKFGKVFVLQKLKFLCGIFYMEGCLLGGLEEIWFVVG